MQWCLFVLVLVHFSLGENNTNLNLNSIPYYEYNPIENGWHAVPATHPLMVNLRQQYPQIPEKYKDFANQTFRRQSNGVCQKEVP